MKRLGRSDANHWEVRLEPTTLHSAQLLPHTEYSILVMTIA